MKKSFQKGPKFKFSAGFTAEIFAKKAIKGVTFKSILGPNQLVKSIGKWNFGPK
jgi:hypothetical protein